MQEADIHARLTRLEAQNRRLRKCGIVLVVLVGASILMGQAKPAPVPKVIEAQRFVVKDAQGNQRGVFGIRDDGTTWLDMTRGKYELRLGVSEAGASIAMKRPETAFALICEKEGCEMQFKDPSGKSRLRLAFTGGKPFVIVADEQGVARASLGGRKNGVPWLRMRDKEGKVVFALMVWKDMPVLMFKDGKGVERMTLRVGEDGAPSIRIYDEKKNEVWGVGARSRKAPK